VVSSTPRPHFTRGKDPVPIVQEAGWAPGPVWTGGKSRPYRDSIPDRPARSQSLYRLSYRAHIYVYTYIYVCVCIYVCVYVCICIYMCMYACIYIYVGVHNMFCAYLPPPFQQNRFTICSQFVCRILFPPRIVIFCRFSSFNSCSSPSSFPSFHNFSPDLLSTILPGIDKGVVQSQLAVGRKGNIVLDKTQSVIS